VTLRRASLVALFVVASCERARPLQRPALRPEAHDAATAHTLVSVADASPDVFVDAAVAVAPAPPPSEPAPPPIPANAEREEPMEDFASENRAMSTVPMPAVPPELAARVRFFRALTNQSMRCWESDGRVSHAPGRECDGLYAQLAEGGVAAVHGIGTYITDDGNVHLYRRERERTRTSARNYDGEASSGAGTFLNTAARLSAAYARLDAPEVVPYVLAATSRTIARGIGDWGAAEQLHTWLGTLVTVTGNDLAPMPPWQFLDLDVGRRMSFLGDAHDTWSRWYRAHRNESLEVWRAQGLARSRTDLTGRDVARRVAAILRFADPHGPLDDQEAARRSLIELLAQRRLSNAGRRYMRDRAAELHWSLDAGDAGLDGGDAALPRSTS
jgi:hypothetical protein